MNQNSNEVATAQEKTQAFKLHESLESVLKRMQENGGAAALINGMFLLPKRSFLCSTVDMFELRRIGFVRKSPDDWYRLTKRALGYLGIEKVEGTPLTAEQLSALQRFAARNGRTWKSALQRLWETGADDRDPDGPFLRRIRSEFGPAWLTRFRLPQTA